MYLEQENRTVFFTYSNVFIQSNSLTLVFVEHKAQSAANKQVHVFNSFTGD